MQHMSLNESRQQQGLSAKEFQLFLFPIEEDIGKKYFDIIVNWQYPEYWLSRHNFQALISYLSPERTYTALGRTISYGHHALVVYNRFGERVIVRVVA